MPRKLLANIFVDGVILQRDMPIKIWGSVGENAQVRVTFDHDAYETYADVNGKWSITLPALPVGKPHKLVVESDGEFQEVNDILIGDVWICSGQSNMEINMLRTRRLFGEYNEIVRNSHIRKYHVPMNYHFHEEQDEIPEASWISVEPGQTEKFTATGFFFANKLYEKTGVPIGIVLSALGGTPIESWMSREALADDPEMLVQANACRVEGYMETETAVGQRISDEWYENLTKFDRGINEKWYSEQFDDDDWNEIDLDVPWDEVAELKANGSIWLRKEIKISEEQAWQSGDLILGTIMDADEVYVNGEQIGGTAYQYPPRDYPIPNLKIGKNTIAIRVITINGIGGFTFGKTHHLLFKGGTKLPLTDAWKYKRALSCPPLTAGPPFFQNRPTGNYNGMIAPLQQLAIKGVIWYQGESNAGQPEGYSKKLGQLITDWRKNWKQGDFPFIFAQLPNWAPKGGLTNWALLRDEQTKTLAVPNTRMVVTYDAGEHNDLHPLNKKVVGERLAGEALSLAYGFDMVATGPTVTTITRTGNQILLDFETFGSKLRLKQGDFVEGLSIWIDVCEIPVEGVIIDGKTVKIETPHAGEVTAVSYAWADDPAAANLCNAERSLAMESLPAVPFKKELIG